LSSKNILIKTGLNFLQVLKKYVKKGQVSLGTGTPKDPDPGAKNNYGPA
jgi:hypothetical protein